MKCAMHSADRSSGETTEEPLGSSITSLWFWLWFWIASSVHCRCIAAASAFSVLFQRFAALSCATRLLSADFMRSSESRFCVHSRDLPSYFQNPMTTDLTSSHSRTESPERRDRSTSSSGKLQFGRRHASIIRSKYAPCSRVVRCRVSARYASVHSGRYGKSAMPHVTPRQGI